MSYTSEASYFNVPLMVFQSAVDNDMSGRDIPYMQSSGTSGDQWWEVFFRVVPMNGTENLITATATIKDRHPNPKTDQVMMLKNKYGPRMREVSSPEEALLYLRDCIM